LTHFSQRYPILPPLVGSVDLPCLSEDKQAVMEDQEDGQKDGEEEEEEEREVTVGSPAVVTCYDTFGVALPSQLAGIATASRALTMMLTMRAALTAAAGAEVDEEEPKGGKQAVAVASGASEKEEKGENDTFARLLADESFPQAKAEAEADEQAEAEARSTSTDNESSPDTIKALLDSTDGSGVAERGGCVPSASGLGKRGRGLEGRGAQQPQPGCARRRRV
jgi:hypothetical protein